MGVLAALGCRRPRSPGWGNKRREVNQTQRITVDMDEDGMERRADVSLLGRLVRVDEGGTPSRALQATQQSIMAKAQQTAETSL